MLSLSVNVWELWQLEAMRAARVKQEEALALMQAQSSVQSMQQLDRIKQKQEGMVRNPFKLQTIGTLPDLALLQSSICHLQVAEAIELASAQTDKRLKAALHQRAQEIVSNLDLSKALSLDTPPEEVVAGAMKEVEAQLQVTRTQLVSPSIKLVHKVA